MAVPPRFEVNLSWGKMYKRGLKEVEAAAKIGLMKMEVEVEIVLLEK